MSPKSDTTLLTKRRLDRPYFVPVSALSPTPNTSTNEEALVRQAARGDKRAFAELYARYRGPVHSIALSRLPPDEAGDLVQDVFERALKRLPKLKKADAFRPWLFMIARNRATDMHRGRRLVSDAGDTIGASSVPRREAREVLVKIRELPEAYQETLLMRLVSGMTGPEIAEACGLKPESVRVNLHRGMKLLREKLEVEKGL